MASYFSCNGMVNVKLNPFCNWLNNHSAKFLFVTIWSYNGIKMVAISLLTW